VSKNFYYTKKRKKERERNILNKDVGKCMKREIGS